MSQSKNAVPEPWYSGKQKSVSSEKTVSNPKLMLQKSFIPKQHCCLLRNQNTYFSGTTKKSS